ncbi:MAG: hypothetical protein WCY29_16850 [Novosphingobium sp.]
MAPRLLLTLLALLTGLAAQLSPAQARIRADGASQVGMFAAIARSERVAVVRPSAPARPVPVLRRDRSCGPVLHAGDDAGCVPTVMLGIDRAHE